MDRDQAIKGYKEAVEELRFSAAAKAGMKERLLATSRAGEETSRAAAREGIFTLLERRFRLKPAVAALLAVVVVFCATTGALAATGTLSKMFGFWADDEFISWGEMAYIPFDMEKYYEYADQQVLGTEDSLDYYTVFETEEELTKATGLKLTHTDDVKLKEIVFDANEKYHIVHMCIVSATAAGQTHTINAQFALEGFENDLGYDAGSYCSKKTVEYSEGKKAIYIVNSNKVPVYGKNGNVSGHAHSLAVYFEEQGIQYQVYTVDTEEGRTFADAVIRSFHGN